MLATGAQDLQQWQFDLVFDPTVVQVAMSYPFDPIPGLFGARFDPGDANTLSYLLGGFVFNSTGLVDDVAGIYPGFFEGVTGDGTLAYIEFTFIAGHENDDPHFAISGVPITQVPEPSTFTLLGIALIGAAATRLRKSGANRTSTQVRRGAV